ncbi:MULTISPECIES: cytochrome c-type biogenesis protein [Achromobacter]|uniref:Cytochrome c-type biogenesis protein n=1 Tax=Achromobacter spanius TaxID=217203 RepID=A0ABY8GUQ0_9BURK|nr:MULTISPECIES: cytochrome c-type biogenesis protein [Achromobacter]WAI82182.1 cytochrome c-type biogenesis protein CcmH [Achromobacter spanius]WEX92272.1 cytochrome c-type biogenesis protein CcmH [Achromobacter sp. SS2-2022]WFP08580.1 cytochrome c-type biogenesis protein CcmH [Achromobacter spanius]
MSGRWIPLTLRQALMPMLMVAILLALSPAIAQAASPSPALAAPTAPALPALSPTDQQRADKLAHGLRCLVCQNQTLADSNAPLAQDMRKLIHAQLAEGRSDTQIMRFFEDRYGDFVRYDPPFKPITWLLWLGPFTLLALGFWVLVRTLKRRAVARAPLTADERARATRFLDTDP